MGARCTAQHRPRALGVAGSGFAALASEAHHPLGVLATVLAGCNVAMVNIVIIKGNI